MVRYLYLIARGEFEITIKSFVDKQVETGPAQLVSFLRPGDTPAPTQTGPVKQSSQQLISQKILVVGPGNMLGLEDIARIQPHSYSVRCVSQTGILLLMEVENFHSVIKHIPKGFHEITRINKMKWKSFFDKLTLLEE